MPIPRITRTRKTLPTGYQFGDARLDDVGPTFSVEMRPVPVTHWRDAGDADADARERERTR